MNEIIRNEVNEENAYSGYVEAGDFIFLSFCVGNVGQSIEKQIGGGFQTTI
jgi:enamine deaminase RidA (YjgF/YER057c/UK114 family)